MTQSNADSTDCPPTSPSYHLKPSNLPPETAQSNADSTDCPMTSPSFVPNSPSYDIADSTQGAEIFPPMSPSFVPNSPSYNIPGKPILYFAPAHDLESSSPRTDYGVRPSDLPDNGTDASDSRYGDDESKPKRPSNSKNDTESDDDDESKPNRPIFKKSKFDNYDGMKLRLFPRIEDQ